MTRRALAIALLCVVSTPSFATKYFVSPSGDDWNDGRSTSTPWRSIAKANTSARAGDTIYLRGGEYVDDPIAPTHSGDAGNPITYTSYQGERPKITSYSINGLSPAALVLTDVSHIVIERISVSGQQPAPNVTVKKFAVFDNASDIEIRDSQFQYAEGWSGFDLLNGSNHIKILRNRIDYVGTYDLAGDDFGDGIWIANNSHHNLIASNFMTHAPHDLLRTRGSYNIVQDNTFDNSWADVEGPGLGGRVLTVDGFRNVFQRNIVRHAATSSDAPRNSGMKVEGIGNIVRRNVLMDNHHDAIQTETGSWQANSRDNRIYHNTIVNNGGAAWRVRFYETDNWPTGNVFKNNLVYGNRQAPRNDGEDADFRIILNDTPVQAPGGNQIINNLVSKSSSNDGRVYLTPPFALIGLGEAQGKYAEIADNIQEAPVFAVNNRFVIDDFELLPGSPGYDDGAPLTVAASTGFGSIVPVADVTYFNDGYGLTPGDILRIGREQNVLVLKVDYDKNELTVSRDISWTEGDAVSLEFEGTAPDIGAVEAGLPTQLTLRPRAPRLIASSGGN